MKMKTGASTEAPVVKIILFSYGQSVICYDPEIMPG